MRPAIVSFAAAIALAGAASAQTLSPAVAHGKQLFTETCAFCHDARGHATRLIKKRTGDGEAQLDIRTDLTPEFVKGIVRHGVMSMPAYRRAELSEAELDDVAAYLTRNSKR